MNRKPTRARLSVTGPRAGEMLHAYNDAPTLRSERRGLLELMTNPAHTPLFHPYRGIARILDVIVEQGISFDNLCDCDYEDDDDGTGDPTDPTRHRVDCESRLDEYAERIRELWATFLAARHTVLGRIDGYEDIVRREIVATEVIGAHTEHA